MSPALSNNGFTFVAWVHLTDGGPPGSRDVTLLTITSSLADGNSSKLEYGVDGYVEWNNGKVVLNISASSAYTPADQWGMFAMVRIGSAVTLYINGNNVLGSGTSPLALQHETNDASIWVGSDASHDVSGNTAPATRFLRGTLSSVALFNTACTDNDVAAIYDATASGAVQFLVPTTTTSSTSSDYDYDYYRRHQGAPGTMLRASCLQRDAG
jgi:hypothetical protein